MPRTMRMIMAESNDQKAAFRSSGAASTLGRAANKTVRAKYLGDILAIFFEVACYELLRFVSKWPESQRNQIKSCATWKEFYVEIYSDLDKKASHWWVVGGYFVTCINNINNNKKIYNNNN